MFLPHKVIGRLKWHKEFESSENSKEQFPCVADAVGIPPKSPAFATLMQTGVLKLLHLWVSAGEIVSCLQSPPALPPVQQGARAKESMPMAPPRAALN